MTHAGVWEAILMQSCNLILVTVSFASRLLNFSSFTHALVKLLII